MQVMYCGNILDIAYVNSDSDVYGLDQNEVSSAGSMLMGYRFIYGPENEIRLVGYLNTLVTSGKLINGRTIMVFDHEHGSCYLSNIPDLLHLADSMNTDTGKSSYTLRLGDRYTIRENKARPDRFGITLIQGKYRIFADTLDQCNVIKVCLDDGYIELNNDGTCVVGEETVTFEKVDTALGSLYDIYAFTQVWCNTNHEWVESAAADIGMFPVSIPYTLPVHEPTFVSQSKLADVVRSEPEELELHD